MSGTVGRRYAAAIGRSRLVACILNTCNVWKFRRLQSLCYAKATGLERTSSPPLEGTILLGPSRRRTARYGVKRGVLRASYDVLSTGIAKCHERRDRDG